MTPYHRGPLGLKIPKAKKDPAHLARVVQLPCCVCDAFGEYQLSPTQVHHTIHGRHSQEKTPDREAIPLCEGHHLGQFDTTKLALHREPDRWRETYGSDRDYIAGTLDKLGV